MTFKNKILDYYSLSLEDYDKRSIYSKEKLVSPDDKDCYFSSVVNRILKAKDDNERVVVYGDYDVDGISATTIMKRTLDALKIKNGYFIPSRYIEGYGLNIDRVRQFKDKGYNLIICVDNGISAHDAISEAKKLGMDVIIIDHHQLPECLPDTELIFHHKLTKFIDYDCSAASLCFFLSNKLLNSIDKYNATLAGLAVFSDVMPLVGNNLILARYLYHNVSSYRNLRYLIGDGYITYTKINYPLISSLNAVGRVAKDSQSTNNCVKFLLDFNNFDNIKKYGDKIKEYDKLKKDIKETMTFKDVKETSHVIILTAESYSGLTGLFANRIMDEKKKACVVFAPVENDENLLVGSIRVPQNYSVKTFFNKYSNQLEQFGGHDKAGGLTIKKSKYLQVMTSLLTEFEKQGLEAKPVEEKYIDISLDEINEANYKVLNDLLPFGEGFKQPLFKIEIDSDQIEYSQNNKAGFVYCKDKNCKVCLFSYNIDFNMLQDKSNHKFKVIGTIEDDYFNNSHQIKFIADKAIAII